MNSIPRFHIAFPVHNLESAREFYVDILGCEKGRESNSWIDFNLYGHQIVAHLSPDDCNPVSTNPVDRDDIPCRHFGVILEWGQWEVLQNRIKDVPKNPPSPNRLCSTSSFKMKALGGIPSARTTIFKI